MSTLQQFCLLSPPATPSSKLCQPVASLTRHHHPWPPRYSANHTGSCKRKASSATRVLAIDRNNTAAGKNGGDSTNKASVPTSNYVVPFDKYASSSCLTRPLVEILRDLNKRIPDNIINKSNGDKFATFIPWYHANRMLSFYAPGWCGEIRDVIFSNNGSVTVVYRLTVRGSDEEAYRECSGTVSCNDTEISDHVGAAEEIAFCRACARFGLGLYLYHE
ncbi:DNA repair RAD52-like protein 2, chloroplastic [Impatiens glandulifera]|uniref:DNA repair RAD52-like protein 2, chloroplastic n=1 Tax=Impatiens glandulifera TaxID=253017 RepID=UPI001FB0D474|nr:DNA repair RAD52-like protein 2, chloroplastic [Impatiens glandulifera]